MKKKQERANLKPAQDLSAKQEHSLQRWKVSARPIPGLLRTTTTLAVAILGFGAVLLGQSASSGALKLKTGEEIFLGGCMTCHGPDGRGMPKSTIRVRATFDVSGLHRLQRDQARTQSRLQSHHYLRRPGPRVLRDHALLRRSPDTGTDRHGDSIPARFLPGNSWPRGELNLPRTLISEKAYPEDETVLTTAINAKGSPGTENTITYERRFGAGNQMEVSFPFSFQQLDTGTWFGGVGDIALGYKRLLFSSLRTGSILSVQGEAALPTGDRARGFGTGTTIFEAFASYGQLLPEKSFFQFQSGAELPTDTAKANRAVYWRTAFGKSLNQGMGLGRMWTPMVELLADRELAPGAKTNWDFVPQLQVTLSKRQHIRANVGVRLPANDFGSRPVQVMFYLLWDWFDGGLRAGW